MIIISKNELKNLRKLTQKKIRKIEQKVIVEGENLINQLISNNNTILNIYITEKYKQKIDQTFTDYKHNQLICNFFLENPFKFNLIDYKDIQALTETENPQEIIAVVKAEHLKPQKLSKVLYLDNIQDPGNLGTIIRTAIASEIDALIISKNSCELFNPKVIRSSLGSVFFCPIIISDFSQLSLQNYTIYTACLQEAINMYEIKSIPDNYIIVIGSESQGISQEIIDYSDIKVKIPISEKIESLNAAISSAILLYYFKGLSINE